jgi:hypothetical protein
VNATGNVTGGNISTAGVVTVTGNITGGNLVTAGDVNTATVTASSTISATGNVTSGNLVTTGDVTTATVTASSTMSAVGNITGNYFIGNGSQLTGIDATSIQNGTSNVKTYLDANVAVSVAGTSNVAVFDSTGVSITGSISGSGNVTGGNIITAGDVTTTTVSASSSMSATGNVTGGNIITAGDVTTATITATGNANVGNLEAATVSVTEITAGGLTLSGNTISSSGTTLTIDPAAVGNTGTVVIAGNLTVQGSTTTYESTTVTINDLVFTVANNASTASAANGGGIEVGPVGSPYATWFYDEPNSRWNTALGINATGNITGGNLSGTNIVGTLETAAQTNITSVGTLSSLSVAGNVTGGNLVTAGIVSATANVTGGNLITSGAVTGNGRALTSLDATNLDTGTVDAARLSGTYTITVSGAATTAGTVTTNAQPNITSVGTLSSLSVTGNITGGNLITAGLVSLASITKTGSNSVGNIGQSDNTFDTVFAKATSAQYADVAEYYVADQNYPVGTVLAFGGNQEVTQTSAAYDTAIAGVVSSNPAVIMNSGLDHPTRVLIALLGRVPCRVLGPVSKGDRLVSGSMPGVAVRLDPDRYEPGTMIGKALEDCAEGVESTIEVVVGRL